MNRKEAIKLARDLRRRSTPAEQFFLDKVRNRRLEGYKFTRQFPIEYSELAYYFADFHCHEKNLIIELDGLINLGEQDYDESRDRILSDMGYRIIRFKNEEVVNEWERIRKDIIHYLTLP